MMMKFHDLLDNAKCYEQLRQLRWPSGVCCPRCGSQSIIRRGKHNAQPDKQRYECKKCQRDFDDLTLSVFSGHHQPLKIWMHCLYLMSLNLSNSQIAHELDLNKDDVQKMTQQLREAVCEKSPDVLLEGEVECDEVYVVTGHKGNPDAVKKKAAKDAETD
ncbi:transposase [Endozoicomonas arenosclerae]|uniref:transposase n=2 Tax=Endozoicomonas arenosclerae TaxID=1633495 RepID=UPI000AE74E99|nr:transposase [Endozoicomonas arenosclerae]